MRGKRWALGVGRENRRDETEVLAQDVEGPPLLVNFICSVRYVVL